MPQFEDMANLVPGTKVITGGLGNQWHGIVVFNNSLRLYGEKYPKKDWEYLGDGFMIEYVEVGLVYSKFIDEDMAIVE